MLATYCCSWICVSASISFLWEGVVFSFVCLFCSISFFLFYLVLFLFLRYGKDMDPDGRGKEGRNWEELGE